MVWNTTKEDYLFTQSPILTLMNKYASTKPPLHLCCTLTLCYHTPASCHAHICFHNTTSSYPLHTQLMHLDPHLLSSSSYHPYTPALPSHALNLLSYAPAPSPEHLLKLTILTLMKNLGLHNTSYNPPLYIILMNPHPCLIISTAYHAYAPTVPSNLLN
ncbi:hypothetical protein O181_010232 [Austropuccinia psidii MF-1]|uniref:Uncharacterized protein n=1 Tax=Austropuccinia psidii MF-1 TaxID=1389203 RepID=A0A9Q3GL09_9BASI|nr:hypothetical protein [Austropuccinia psidii MF-1]